MSSIERAMGEGRPRQEEPAPTGQDGDDGPRRSRAGRTAEAFDAGGHIELDLPLLGAQGFLTPGGGDSRLQEEYRIVKRPLLSHAFAPAAQGRNPGNLIQVTSANLGEGKTFTVFNLGMSIGMELDYTVLLIDGDITRRTLTHLVGLSHRPGLTDVLEADGKGLSEVIVNTNVPNLRILPAGEVRPHSTELMASAHMKRVSEELAARYPDRLVLFDSPPLLMDSQAATLAGHMGQVLIVVEAGRTTEGMVKEGLNLLEQSAARPSFLLNKSPRGYGAGYYYGRY